MVKQVRCGDRLPEKRKGAEPEQLKIVIDDPAEDDEPCGFIFLTATPTARGRLRGRLPAAREFGCYELFCHRKVYLIGVVKTREFGSVPS
jgi:hypothetical protein